MIELLIYFNIKIQHINYNIELKIQMAIFQVINRNRKSMTFNRKWKKLLQQQRHLVATIGNLLKHQPIGLFVRLPPQRVNTCFNALCAIWQPNLEIVWKGIWLSNIPNLPHILVSIVRKSLPISSIWIITWLARLVCETLCLILYDPAWSCLIIITLYHSEIPNKEYSVLISLLLLWYDYIWYTSLCIK